MSAEHYAPTAPEAIEEKAPYPANMVEKEAFTSPEVTGEKAGYEANVTEKEPGVQVVEGGNEAADNGPTIEEIRESKKGLLAYIKTRDFWILLVAGQLLALCLTATNTFTTFLADAGTSIPAFQSLFNYILLSLIYLTYTIHRYTPRGYLRFLRRDWWRYLLLSFCDVEGNYFTVLAYRYTTILSATLINFWAIAVVVAASFLFLGVRYRPTQLLGILVCIGGLGILLASDHLTGGDDAGAVDSGDQLKGDLFALLGATFYGAANVFEEYLLSERPLYEVVGQLGQWGMLINGVQAAIFDRGSFQAAVWSGAVGGWLAGYTVALALFYSAGPLIFRMGSAAFFNIGLLTTNFWGVVVGVEVFGLTIHFLYPIAFVCIILGQVAYFLGRKVFADAWKPWLGRNQEKGVSGVGTARRRAERPDVIV